MGRGLGWTSVHMAAGLQNKQPRLLLPQVSPTRSSMLLVLRQISAQELSNSVATSSSTTAPQAFGVPPTLNSCPDPPAATSILHIAGHRAASAVQQRLPSDQFGFFSITPEPGKRSNSVLCAARRSYRRLSLLFSYFIQK